MGVENGFKPVKLFTGIIYREEELYLRVRQQLTETFSPTQIETAAIPFDFTTYYNQEMGTPLTRRFIAFETLIPPEQLPAIKRLTNRLETESAVNGCRQINLDPGYLSEANVIIATTKNYYHRVPLTQGIYAHMEYVIKKKKLFPLEWTYPDFKSATYMEFFENLLLLYKKDLKE